MKKFAFILVLFLNSMGFAQPSQIIAVAAVDKTQNSQVSQEAARAPYYLIFNECGKLLEVISNPFRDADRHAGPQAAGLLAEKNVTVMVAGHFGHKIKIALEEKGIRHFAATGVVRKAFSRAVKQKQPMR